MENQTTNQTVPQTTYSIISYSGSQLPEAYVNMVYSKTLRSLRYGNEYFKLIDSAIYYKVYHDYLASILKRPSVQVKLAVLTEDQDVVLGFSIVEDKTLHYVHTHKDYRKQGIGTSLIPKDVDTITHITNTAMTIWTNNYPNVKFNPFK